MQRPTIVHMISSPARGAPRELMLRLLAAIDRDRYQPAVAFLREGWDEIEAFGLDSMLPEFSALDIPLHIAGMEQVWDVRGAGRLDAFLREVGAKLLVSHLNRADLWAGTLGWWGRARTVRVVHGLEDWRTATLPDPRWAARMLDRVLLTRTSRVVCVSKESRRLLVEYQGIDPDRAVWIPGGIDIGRFAVDAPPFPGDRPPTIGMVSRLHTPKGIYEFVHAVAEAQRSLPGTRAVVAGHGPEADEMAVRAAQAGAEITFLGQVPNVHEVLAGIDVWALPSYHEGTPLSLLEAMAAGRAIVATDVGGIPFVIDDGRSGLLVPPQDGPALAKAVIGLLQDPARSRELGAAALAASKDYSVDTMCSRWAELYDDVFAESPV